MRLGKIKIKNFRLLCDVELALENETTLIVGRNNSGKTSLSELLRRLLGGDKPAFEFEDFSTATYDRFCDAHSAYAEGQEEAEVRARIPAIELRLHFHYDAAQPNLGPLTPFVIDLDLSCVEAVAVVRYELKDGFTEKFFKGQPTIGSVADAKTGFLQSLRDRIPHSFAVKVWAEDPKDASNRKSVALETLRSLIRTSFINAQRGLDDNTFRESDALAKIFENVFTTASSPLADPMDKQIADELTASIRVIQEQLDGNFDQQLKNLIPVMNHFVYPGLTGQSIQTETTLDVGRLLSNFTKVRYQGYAGITLPESYNGLGVRNLIYILLKIVQFYKTFCAEETAPGVHIVFIEEPEAHLHPQMQEVFIRQLSKLVRVLVESTQEAIDWPVQFVVSTHSSHIANEARFETIRYFLASKDESGPTEIRSTRVKDLRTGSPGMANSDLEFLHQYLTLTRCDLFFADKAVLVEGLSERLLLPLCIHKLEESDPQLPRLSSQYIAVMEVGGAYAHLFFDLVDFLELQSLVITDIDSVSGTQRECSSVSDGETTSNACLIAWFEKANPLSLPHLLAATAEERTRKHIHLVYQCPELKDGPCGRTLEDAFILANPNHFDISATTRKDIEAEALARASKVKKSAFALKYAIRETDWAPPSYILNGLRWLAQEHNGHPSPPATADAPASTKTNEAIGNV